MSRRRTSAERSQDRKLSYVPMWPLVGVLLLIGLLVVLSR